MSDSRENFIAFSSSSDIHLFRARSQMSKIHKEILFLWENTRWCMICKQTYSYTTPLPPSLTEIFFPSEETSPSPLTTCVPFSVVSTLNSRRGGENFWLEVSSCTWILLVWRDFQEASWPSRAPSKCWVVSFHSYSCGAYWQRSIVHYSK